MRRPPTPTARRLHPRPSFTFKVQRRRHRRERLVLHHHPRRHRRERPRDRASDDLGDGPRRPDADRRRERDQGRCRRPACARQLPLPVAARLGRQRDADPERRRQDLPPGVGRRRCQVQGARQLHRPRRPPRGPHQRRLADAADGFGEHRADGRRQDGDPRRGRLEPLLRGRLRVPGRRRRCACQRADHRAPGGGVSDARRQWGPGERHGDQDPARRRRPGLHPAARRQRRRLRQLHLQGRRRHRRERLGLHHHPRRRRGERPRDRASDDLRDGPRRPDADRRRERDQGRCRRPAAGLQLPLPVAARLGRQRDADPERRRQDLPPGVGRRRCQVQGARQLHRPRRPPRGPHQRRLADAADGFGEHRADGGVEDDRPGRGRLPPLLRGRLRVPGRRRRCACQRHDRHASGPGQGRARPRRHSRDRQPGDRRRAAGPARVRPAARRQRRRLRQLHVQGQRRHRRERLGLHHHPRRDGGERPRDGGAHDLRHGACGACADGGRERDRGRCRRPAAGLQLPLPVAARLGRQRDADPGRQRQHLPPGGG